MPREYPAVEVSWPGRPTDDQVEHLLALIDDAQPSAVEERGDGVRVFFANTEARARAAVLVEAAGVACRAIDVSDEDWAERSQASLAPIRVGNLVVSPPGRDLSSVARGAQVIEILPSMGFGTGHHASTRLCLALLQRAELSDARVVDVGTGSGVLALAAWRLGAKDVIAADFDPDAITSAIENVERNGATNSVWLLQADLAHLPETLTKRPFDALLANLTGGLLARYAATLVKLVRPGGTLITSGFQPEDDSLVANAMSEAGAHLVERVTEEDWVGATFRR